MPGGFKVYKEIAGDQAALLQKNFMRPTSFINQLG